MSEPLTRILALGGHDFTSRPQDLIWEGAGPPSAVTAQRGARAYRVAKDESGVVESPLPSRFLPAPAPAALREDIAEFRRISALRKKAGWLG
jgi:hypothetical protein